MFLFFCKFFLKMNKFKDDGLNDIFILLVFYILELLDEMKRINKI